MSLFTRLFGVRGNKATDANWPPNFDLLGKRDIMALTSTAAKVIKEIFEKLPEAEAAVRVDVEQGGPAGYVYDLRIERNVDPACDVASKSRGIWIIFHAEHADFLQGTVIDFRDSPEGAGFKFLNPNARYSD
jgi:iron-sulfur cluster assembly accessory protein